MTVSDAEIERLAAICYANGRTWATYPFMGWCLGLSIHGAVVLASGSGLMERMVEQERRRRAVRRDPW